METRSYLIPEIEKEYRVLAILGEGGMGKVYLAQERELNRLVALKVLRLGIEADYDDLCARLRNEATTLAQLNHPHIVTVYRLLLPRNWYPALVMEYIEGPTIRNLLRVECPMTLQRMRAVMVPVIKALHFAHENGVIHRDIKPSNIIIRAKDGMPKLLDFSIARDQKLERRLTTITSALGTPQYMSPEQCNGKALDFRSDLYSLGVTLYECLSGHPPFDDERKWCIEKMHNEDPPPPLDVQQLGIPQELADLIYQCLHKEPRERPPSALAVARALEILLPPGDPEQPHGPELPPGAYDPGKGTDASRKGTDSSLVRRDFEPVSLEGAAGGGASPNESETKTPSRPPARPTPVTPPARPTPAKPPSRPTPVRPVSESRGATSSSSAPAPPFWGRTPTSEQETLLAPELLPSGTPDSSTDNSDAATLIMSRDELNGPEGGETGASSQTTTQMGKPGARAAIGKAATDHKKKQAAQGAHVRRFIIMAACSIVVIAALNLALYLFMHKTAPVSPKSNATQAPASSSGQSSQPAGSGSATIPSGGRESPAAHPATMKYMEMDNLRRSGRLFSATAASPMLEKALPGPELVLDSSQGDSRIRLNLQVAGNPGFPVDIWLDRAQPPRNEEWVLAASAVRAPQTLKLDLSNILEISSANIPLGTVMEFGFIVAQSEKPSADGESVSSTSSGSSSSSIAGIAAAMNPSEIADRIEPVAFGFALSGPSFDPRQLPAPASDVLPTPAPPKPTPEPSVSPRTRLSAQLPPYYIVYQNPNDKYDVLVQMVDPRAKFEDAMLPWLYKFSPEQRKNAFQFRAHSAIEALEKAGRLLKNGAYASDQKWFIPTDIEDSVQLPLRIAAYWKDGEFHRDGGCTIINRFDKLKVEPGECDPATTIDALFAPSSNDSGAPASSQNSAPADVH